MSHNLVVNQIDVRFGASRVLAELSLSVAPGEFLTLLGPSGSGKTTLLNAIAGFTQISSGNITIDQERIDKLRPEDRGLGVVFQNYALFPHMTVGQNIEFPLVVRKIPARVRRRKTDAILQLVDLGAFYGREIRTLSGGQRQRVALARALVFEPRILLLDEPLSALDKNLRVAMQRELSRIQKELNVTTICVTHDQGEALSMSDTIAILHEGVLQQVGTPRELYEAPINVFVASFIGESNFLLPDDPLLQSHLPPISSDSVAVVRPENIRISPRLDGHESRTTGVIRSVSYQGATAMLEVSRSLPGASSVKASIDTSRELSRTFQPGEPVRIEFDTRDAVVISDSNHLFERKIES